VSDEERPKKGDPMARAQGLYEKLQELVDDAREADCRTAGQISRHVLDSLYGPTVVATVFREEILIVLSTWIEMESEA
jgi:hypothetical protein